MCIERAHPSTANQVMRAGSFCTKKVKPSTKSAATLVCGFTLIEVVVVSAVALVLGQAAIPQFLGVRDRAEARAKTAAAVGIAKECGILKGDVGNSSGVVDPATRSVVVCDQSSVSVITSQSWNVPQTVECADSVLTVTSVTLQVSAAGVFSCS